MARRSALLVKQDLAKARETRIERRECRDDGCLRRNAREPLTAVGVRAISQERKTYVGRYQRLMHERFIARRLSPDAAELRAELVGDVLRLP